MEKQSRTVSRAQLARLAGVSKPAITKRCKGDLAPALIGDRVALDNPLVRQFLADHGASAPAAPRAPTGSARNAAPSPGVPTASPKGTRKRTPSPTAPGPQRDDLGQAQPGSQADLAWIAEQLRPLLERFGSDESLRNWLLGWKELEIIREKRLGNEETEGELISRALVRTHVFGRIEACNRRLLGDLPKTLVARVYALASTDTTPEVAEEVARDLIGSQLDPMTREVERVLSAK